MQVGAFVTELRQRRVIRAVVVWGVVAFAVLQIYEAVMHGLHLPEWTLGFVVVILGLGFPITVALAWIFELTRDGVSRAPINRGSGLKGAPLVLVLVGFGLFAAAPGTAWYFLHTAATATRPAPVVASAASIAVLPFADMSPQHDQEYFSDGVAEEILDALAQIEGLHVAGRTSSFSFKGKNEDLRSIGRKLNVAHVLEGSVRREGNRVRITAELISTGDGYHLWSRTFERELTGIFAVQDEIARLVVEALSVRLLHGKLPSREPRIVDPDAHDQYLLGKQLFNRESPESFQRAIVAFDKATALDPSFSSAWAGLAAALFAFADNGDMSPGETERFEERALAAAEKAIVVGHEVADGYSVRGYLRVAIRWDWSGALIDLKQALALAPGDAPTHSRLAVLLGAIGRIPEAIAEDQRAVDLDPLDATAWEDIGHFYGSLAQMEKARAALKRALEIAPGAMIASRELAFTYLVEGKPAAARPYFDGTVAEWSRLSGAALVEYDLGHAQEAQRALDALSTRFAHNAALQIAEIYAWRGESDRAFEWLERAYRQRDTGMRYVKHTPMLRKIRGDPRFAAMLKKMNLPVD